MMRRKRLTAGELLEISEELTRIMDRLMADGCDAERFLPAAIHLVEHAAGVRAVQELRDGRVSA